MKAVKWLSIIFGSLILLVILTIILAPMFIDVQKYKPHIENKVTEATGRPFSIGGDLDLSVFPWLGISLSDLHLGNPSRFKEKDFVNVESFEVRVKLLPLISKKLEVKRFIMKRPHILLIKDEDGVGNWQGLAKASTGERLAEKAQETKETEKKIPAGKSPIKQLIVGEFAVTDGRILWIDRAKDDQKEISNINLELDSISPDQPIHVELSAMLDESPVSLEGTLGPAKLDSLQGAIPVTLSIKALNELNIQIKGNVIDPASLHKYDFDIQVDPFFPRKAMRTMNLELPFQPKNPQSLSKIALKAHLRGDNKNVSVSEATLDFDQSKIDFNFMAKEFENPNLAFNITLDQIDMDGYLPQGAREEKAEQAEQEKKPRPDYAPLRKLVMNGEIKIGQLKAYGAKIEDIYMKITGLGGKIRFDPLDMKLYQGTASSDGMFDFRQDFPKININLQAKSIKANPIVNDLLKKDIIEGTLESKISIAMTGDELDKIKSSMNGNGSMVFRDGAIKGIDLPGMIRNVKASFGLGEKGKRLKTDFTEFNMPFTITNGVFKTNNTNLLSPLLRVKAAGKADLVKETVDFRVEPKFVASLKGQGDTMERLGLTVPILVSGSFESLSFKPDLTGIVKGTLPSSSDLKDSILGPNKREGPAINEKKVKDLLKKLPFGE